MKKFSLILLFVAIILIIPIYAYGDVGPKPSVVVNFEGFEGEMYYVTLLSEKPTTGPYSAVGLFEGSRRYSEEDVDYEIWQKFVSFQDRDGYYFLQYFNDCTETSQFTWGYYPPYKFKILVYFPELDSFAVSGIYERYAFDSYYKVDVREIKLVPSATIEGITAERNYNYTWEIISLFARIIATIGIEIFLALALGYRQRTQIGIILKTNIATQTILNTVLNLVAYKMGGLAFVIIYFLAEILVFIIEAVVYANKLTKYGTGRLGKKSYATFYALAANVLSFITGIYIAQLIPGIF